jgi:Holliday junction resolvase RusA-like endonuclease
MPIVHVLNLPFPVSVNRLWRRAKHGGMYKSPLAKRWIAAADEQVLVDKILRGARTIDGPFEAEILLNSEIGRRTDADNCAKTALDFAQSRGLISNDKFARRITIDWVPANRAPVGCKLILRQICG